MTDLTRLEDVELRIGLTCEHNEDIYPCPGCASCGPLTWLWICSTSSSTPPIRGSSPTPTRKEPSDG